MTGSESILEREQWIPAPIHEVFAFFSEAKNLDSITPPWLHFNVHGGSGELKAGTLIRYTLNWHGFPLRWTTRIEEWRPPAQFVDVQLKGPYRLWHHTHTFRQHEDGTLMRDRVRFRLPLGMLGEWCAGWLVREDVKRIFDYRQQQIEAIFHRSTQ